MPSKSSFQIIGFEGVTVRLLFIYRTFAYFEVDTGKKTTLFRLSKAGNVTNIPARKKKTCKSK